MRINALSNIADWLTRCIMETLVEQAVHRIASLSLFKATERYLSIDLRFSCIIMSRYTPIL